MLVKLPINYHSIMTCGWENSLDTNGPKSYYIEIQRAIILWKIIELKHSDNKH